MPYRHVFSDPYKDYVYAPGKLYLGLSGKNIELGIQTERHAITIAGAGSGKGAALMIPNLLRWPHNALVIDPKGEAAEHTAEARERMGQAVHVLDPFGIANVPPRFRARFNPLSSIDRASISAREDINVIADGLVMRHDPRAGHWDGGALSVIAGLIAYVCDRAPPENRTLPEIRSILTAPGDMFGKVVSEMATNVTFGNLPATAATKLTKSGSEAGHFISNADENTKWLDSQAISAVLSDSTFDLADLKTKPCTVYLVLPAHLLGEHGRFLRLFVRCALNAMAKGGTKGGRRCLFMLDEFYSLGHIDEIAKASGLMRGYGVSLWPIMQSMGQLEELYGRQMASDFFANADAHIFFGNTDAPTLDYISQRIGVIHPNDLNIRPPQIVINNQVIVAPTPPFIEPSDPLRPLDRNAPSAVRFLHGLAEIGHAAGKAADVDRQRNYTAQLEAYNHAIAHMHANDKNKREQLENELRDYQYAMSEVGRARVPPDAVREFVMKGEGDPVARNMIVFAKGGAVLGVKLAPYFLQSRRSPGAAVSSPASASVGGWLKRQMERLRMGAWGTIPLSFVVHLILSGGAQPGKSVHPLASVMIAFFVSWLAAPTVAELLAKFKRR